MKIIWGIPVVLMFIAFIRADEMLDNAVEAIMDMMDMEMNYGDKWKTPAHFTEATADFIYMHERHPVAGQLLDNGNFIFSYSWGMFRFMILTSNDGVMIKGGHMSAISPNWKDTRQWNTLGTSGEYGLKNFKGTKRGEFQAFTAIHTSDGMKKMGELEFKYDAIEQCMRIKGTIDGLKPGLHGTHIHYYGDGHQGGCMATKGHYNPFKDGAKEYDIGDLGNISADVNGVANVNICNKVVHTIGQFSVIGRSVVVHAGPNGNAGKRVGCGVIAREFPRI